MFYAYDIYDFKYQPLTLQVTFQYKDKSKTFTKECMCTRRQELISYFTRVYSRHGLWHRIVCKFQSASITIWFSKTTVPNRHQFPVPSITIGFNKPMAQNRHQLQSVSITIGFNKPMAQNRHQFPVRLNNHWVQ